MSNELEKVAKDMFGECNSSHLPNKLHITSEDILVLVLGVKLFGNETTLVGVQELLERKSFVEHSASSQDLEAFSLKFIKELRRLTSKKTLVEFPNARNSKEWNVLFKFENGRFICRQDRLEAIYGKYLEIQKIYPFPAVRRCCVNG